MMKYLSSIVHWFTGLTRPVPSRDWHTVLVLILLLGAAVVGIALYFYLGLQSGAIIVPQAPTHVSPPSVSRDKLSKVLEVYQQRALNYNAGNFAPK
jgi:hypothetical protein